MPGLSARVMGQAVQRLNPVLPVLFMSGYPGEDVVRRGLLSPNAPFLQKPFSLEDLSLRVRSLLDHASEAPR